MTALIELHLHAQAPARNVHRMYSITVQRTLFSEIEVEVRFGRIGNRPRILRRCFADHGAAARYTRRHLQRRLSAPRRIGAGYAVVSAYCARTQNWADWVPAPFILGSAITTAE